MFQYTGARLRKEGEMKRMRKLLAFLSAFALVALAAMVWMWAASVPSRAGTAPEGGVALAASAAPMQNVLLVNRENPLPKGYAPVELVNLYEQERSFQLASSNIYLERAAFEAAERMFAQAEADGVDGFILTSGYRTEEKQWELYNADQNGTAAKPGHSEHQTGLAFDVTAYRDSGGFETTRQFRWLIEHCWDYGFILRYPEGREDVTGFAYEPWHYRYVGAEVACAIREACCTLEEYCARRAG